MDDTTTNPSWRLTRRHLLRASAGLIALGLWPKTAARAAEDAAAPHTPQYLEALSKLTGDRKPVATRVKLDLPDLAENGNMVPFTVAVDSPMTPQDNVRWLSILSTANPQALIGTFYFSPASGRATISGRLRLARTQDVVAIAELADGSLVTGLTTVKVTVGGCGAG